MPISFISRGEQLSVYVWELTEDSSALLQKAELTADEYERYCTFRSESRRYQWLAVRALINKVFGAKVLITYDEEGRPYIDQQSKYVSISHTNSYVAVLVGDCRYIGVDIEGINRNYSKIESKFVASNEAAIFKTKGFSGKLYLPLIWSAKEAAFKAAFRCELDFVNDLSVISVEADDKFAVGEIVVRLNPIGAEGRFKFYTFNNHVIVWGEYGNI